MKIRFAAVASLLVAASMQAAQVDRVLVRQQWPWSQDVRVEYVVSGASALVAVEFEFYDGGTRLPVADATAIKGDRLYAKAGTNVATFDPRQLFGPAAPAEYNAFSVKVSVGDADASMNDRLYRIVDLDTGVVTDIMRGELVNGKYGSYETSYSAINSDFSTTLSDVFIWTDVTNNPAYRTSKMVFRRIPAANVEWMMGTNTTGVTLATSMGGATPHLVKLTSDFYIGVFPVTQMQYVKIYGSYGGSFKNSANFPDHDEYPVAGVAYSECRGSDKHWTVDGHDVDSGSFLYKLRAKVLNAISFDLPTEAQWEFACRGGNYIAPVYSGKAYGMNSLKELAWCSDNSVGFDNKTQVHVVGQKYPNAYGLYDTCGNVYEWCLDWSDMGDYAWTSKTEPEVDPQGVPYSSITLNGSGVGNHIVRGSAYNATRTNAHPAFRFATTSYNTGSQYGFRVCFPAD